MTRNQDPRTEITDHEGIARSRQGMRSPRTLSPAPNQPAKPLQCTYRHLRKRPRLSGN